MKKTFAMTGVGGFIAPRHLKAIKETGGDLLAALDIHDSVGIIDSYFPAAAFFMEFEAFDRHIAQLRRKSGKLDYVSVCSPNYLHDPHIRFALRNNADAICEKPLVLNPWELDSLAEIASESRRQIFTILQLRLHPAIQALKAKIDAAPKDKIFDVDLSYLTSRGQWYYTSWKGAVEKSGGIATNIGIHFFDMLNWVFGPATENTVHMLEEDCAAGFLVCKRARIRWFLSINSAHLPASAKQSGKSTYRSITLCGEEVEFSEGFTDLHTASYRHILDGNGFGIEEARPSVELAYAIRHTRPIGLSGDYHPFAAEITKQKNAA